MCTSSSVLPSSLQIHVFNWLLDISNQTSNWNLKLNISKTESLILIIPTNRQTSPSSALIFSVNGKPILPISQTKEESELPHLLFIKSYWLCIKMYAAHFLQLLLPPPWSEPPSCLTQQYYWNSFNVFPIAIIAPQQSILKEAGRTTHLKC